MPLARLTHNDKWLRTAYSVAAPIRPLRPLSNEIKDRVRVEVNLPELQSTQANNNRLSQVFVNLLQDSVDGLKEKSFDGEQPTIWINGRVDSEKSVAIIRDNGQGIEPRNIGKIFDPFFTTKDVGQGMGLGLSICYRIVQEYEGQIRVKSERGKFCEFTLEFFAKSAL